MAAAFLAGLLIARAPAEAAEPEYVFTGGHYYPGTGRIIIVNIDNYYSYLNLSVRPVLLSISASFTGVACEAVGQDHDGVVDRLLEAKDAAQHGLSENLRVQPPEQFKQLHNTIQAVFQDTTTTADKLVGCMRGADPACPEAQEDLVSLLDSAGQLTRDVKQLVKAPALP